LVKAASLSALATSRTMEGYEPLATKTHDRQKRSMSLQADLFGAKASS
jgi:hypothetical protein